MLVLNPWRVRFGSAVWEGVASVVVDRVATREVVAWGDGGAHVVLADAPEQRVTVSVTQDMGSDDLDAPKPGDAGDVVIYTAPAGSEAGRRRVRIAAVVLRVTHEVSAKRGVTRKIVLVGVSADGAGDPVVVEAVAGAEA